MDQNQPAGGPGPVDPNDKLIAAATYPISFILSAVILLTDMKNKPGLKFHAIQSLVANVAIWILVFVLSTVLSITIVGLICVPFVPAIWLVTLYWAYQVYQGQPVVIPFVTDFIKNQHWV